MALENQLKIPKDSHVLAICATGLVRSPGLKDILEQHGYTNVSYGGVAPGITNKRATKEMLESADVIVVVDTDVRRWLLDQYHPKDKQKFVELEVYDDLDPVTGQTQDLPDINGNLEEQIALYLID